MFSCILFRLTLKWVKIKIRSRFTVASELSPTNVSQHHVTETFSCALHRFVYSTVVITQLCRLNNWNYTADTSALSPLSCLPLWQTCPGEQACKPCRPDTSCFDWEHWGTDLLCNTRHSLQPGQLLHRKPWSSLSRVTDEPRDGIYAKRSAEQRMFLSTDTSVTLASSTNDNKATEWSNSLTWH